MAKEIELAWMPGANLWPINIDPAQMNRILANLCINSRDAVGSHGEIIIETKNVIIAANLSTRHTTHLPGQFVMLAVSDTGCGMDENTLKKLFEPFFTTSELGKGTGLDLPLFTILSSNTESLLM